ncbi:hypothetical protein EDD21DRAFT_147138 [Dissophora ornata]|nr:hypothetical protein EDD21DRAFT_147138 [Dissophora ornata]
MCTQNALAHSRIRSFVILVCSAMFNFSCDTTLCLGHTMLVADRAALALLASSGEHFPFLIVATRKDVWGERAGRLREAFLKPGSNQSCPPLSPPPHPPFLFLYQYVVIFINILPRSKCLVAGLAERWSRRLGLCQHLRVYYFLFPIQRQQQKSGRQLRGVAIRRPCKQSGTSQCYRALQSKERRRIG